MYFCGGGGGSEERWTMLLQPAGNSWRSSIGVEHWNVFLSTQHVC
jgi:hypothetical protein